MFELLDKSGSGQLQIEELFDFLFASAALVTALLAVANGVMVSQPPSAQTVSALRDDAWKRAHNLFTEADIDVDSPVTSNMCASREKLGLAILDNLCTCFAQFRDVGQFAGGSRCRARW